MHAWQGVSCPLWQPTYTWCWHLHLPRLTFFPNIMSSFPGFCQLVRAVDRRPCSTGWVQSLGRQADWLRQSPFGTMHWAESYSCPGCSPSSGHPRLQFILHPAILSSYYPDLACNVYFCPAQTFRTILDEMTAYAVRSQAWWKRVCSILDLFFPSSLIQS